MIEFTITTYFNDGITSVSRRFGLGNANRFAKTEAKKDNVSNITVVRG